MEDLITSSNKLMQRARERGCPAEKIRYACLEGTETAFVAAGNARALHHLFTLRGSEAIGGDNRAAPEFLALADEMYHLASNVAPVLFQEVIKS